jgi:adenosine deaminase
VSAPRVTRALLERLPKAELHCHLDGSVRPGTLLELAREHRVAMPRDDAESLGEYMIVRDATNLEDYLERFSVTLSVMQTAEAIARISYELAEDASREGVLYLEIRFAPILNQRMGLSLEEVVVASIEGLEAASRDHGIVAKVIVCGLRHLDPALTMELARVAVDLRRNGVVGFDLAGAEAGHPAGAHAAAFEYAGFHGLNCTCHAGEGDGASSIHSAVHSCGAQRVGHGTRLYEDPELTRYIRDRQIALEMCLTSNVQTRAAASYATHPLRRYFDDGLNVVLNTDNRLMSGVTLVDEYALAHRELGFTFEELGQIALNGFRSAFLDDGERAALLSRARHEIEALTAGA